MKKIFRLPKRLGKAALVLTLAVSMFIGPSMPALAATVDDLKTQVAALLTVINAMPTITTAEINSKIELLRQALALQTLVESLQGGTNSNTAPVISSSQNSAQIGSSDAVVTNWQLPYTGAVWQWKLYKADGTYVASDGGIAATSAISGAVSHLFTKIYYQNVTLQPGSYVLKLCLATGTLCSNGLPITLTASSADKTAISDVSLQDATGNATRTLQPGATQRVIWVDQNPVYPGRVYTIQLNAANGSGITTLASAITPQILASEPLPYHLGFNVTIPANLVQSTYTITVGIAPANSAAKILQDNWNTSEALGVSGAGTAFRVVAPNGGEVWQSVGKITDTISGNEAYRKDVSWVGSASQNPNDDTVVAYLEKKKSDGSYEVVGRIPPFSYGSIAWVVGVIGPATCDLNYPSDLPNNCFNQSKMILVPGGQYYVRLVDTITNRSDRSDAAFTISATGNQATIAAPVLSLRAVWGSDIQIDWINTSSAVTSYRVYRKAGAGSITLVDTTAASIADCAANVTAICARTIPSSTRSWRDTFTKTPGVYTYAVVARYANEDKISNSISATAQTDINAGVTRPTNITNLTATVSGNRIVLTWTKPTGHAAYDVYRSTASNIPLDDSRTVALRFKLNKDLTTFTDTTAAAGVTYYYTVVPISAHHLSTGSNTNGTSNHASALIPVAGATPSVIASILPIANQTTPRLVVAGGALPVQWVTANTATTSVDIYYRSASATQGYERAESAVPNVPNNPYSWITPASLQPGSYVLSVGFNSPDGVTTYRSADIPFTVIAAKSVNAGTLSVLPKTGGGISVSWANSVAAVNSAGFNIFRSPSPITDAQIAPSVVLSGTVPNCTSANVLCRFNPGLFNGGNVTAETVTDFQVSPGQSYHYLIQGTDGRVIYYQTPSVGPVVAPAQGAVTRANPVTNFIATREGNNIRLRWTLPAAAIAANGSNLNAGYTIYRRTTNSLGSTSSGGVVIFNAAAAEYLDAGADFTNPTGAPQAGQTYYYWIFTRGPQNGADNSGPVMTQVSPASAQSIVLTTPAAGATYTIGQSVPVSWTYAGIGGGEIFTVQLKAAAAASWSNMITARADTNTFNALTSSATPTGNVEIRVCKEDLSLCSAIRTIVVRAQPATRANPVTNFTAVREGNNIRLNWTAPAPALNANNGNLNVQYVIYRRTVSNLGASGTASGGIAIPLSTTTYLDNGSYDFRFPSGAPQAGQTYYYFIFTIGPSNGADNSGPVMASVGPADALDATFSGTDFANGVLTATAGQTKTLNMNVTGSGTFTGALSASLAGYPIAITARTAPTTVPLSITVPALQAAGNYTVTVTLDKSGTTQRTTKTFTLKVDAATVAATRANPVTNFTATREGNNIRLRWTLPAAAIAANGSNLNAGYTIYRRTTNSLGSTASGGVVLFTPGATEYLDAGATFSDPSGAPQAANTYYYWIFTRGPQNAADNSGAVMATVGPANLPTVAFTAPTSATVARPGTSMTVNWTLSNAASAQSVAVALVKSGTTAEVNSINFAAGSGTGSYSIPADAQGSYKLKIYLCTQAVGQCFPQNSIASAESQTFTIEAANTSNGTLNFTLLPLGKTTNMKYVVAGADAGAIDLKVQTKTNGVVPNGFSCQLKKSDGSVVWSPAGEGSHNITSVMPSSVTVDTDVALTMTCSAPGYASASKWVRYMVIPPLSVTITPSKTTVQPGEQLTLTIQRSAAAASPVRESDYVEIVLDDAATGVVGGQAFTGTAPITFTAPTALGTHTLKVYRALDRTLPLLDTKTFTVAAASASAAIDDIAAPTGLVAGSPTQFSVTFRNTGTAALDNLNVSFATTNGVQSFDSIGTLAAGQSVTRSYSRTFASAGSYDAIFALRREVNGQVTVLAEKTKSVTLTAPNSVTFSRAPRVYIAREGVIWAQCYSSTAGSAANIILTSGDITKTAPAWSDSSKHAYGVRGKVYTEADRTAMDNVGHGFAQSFRYTCSDKNNAANKVEVNATCTAPAAQAGTLNRAEVDCQTTAVSAAKNTSQLASSLAAIKAMLEALKGGI